MNGKSVRVFFVVFMAFVSIGLGQRVLVDDAPMCGHHSRHTYSVLWDSLTTYGATVSFTTEIGRSFSTLDSYDMLIIMHHKRGCAIPGQTGFSNFQRNSIIRYVCDGGNVLIMPITPNWGDEVNSHNALLSDWRWNTGVIYTGGGGRNLRTTNIAPYPPYTDGLEYLYFQLTEKIEAEPPAYPFAWSDDGEQTLAVISYPTSEVYPCSCEFGGRLVVLPDNHTLEAPVVGFIEPMGHRFIVNIMQAMAGLTDLDDCIIPPGVPIAEVDTCLNPGEIVTVFGENLYDPMQLTVGTTVVPITAFASDSTSFSFICPDLPQGNYSVRLTRGLRSDVIGNLRIYCDWISISAFANGCYREGDTVEFFGENFSVGSISVSLITEGFSDTIPVTHYSATSPSTGWFIVPDDLDYEDYASYFVLVRNTDLGNSDYAFIWIPCPCPGQDTLFNMFSLSPRAVDTYIPIIAGIEIDSCYFLSYGEIGIEYHTRADSFMSVPLLWPDRLPLRPISIDMSSDGGATWTRIATNIRNTGSFIWGPPAVGDYMFIISSIDDFGNTSSDTIGVCIDDFLIPPLTGAARAWAGCEPDSVIFTVRDSAMVDEATLKVQFVSDSVETYFFPDLMRWADDTTLIFYPPLPYSDSTNYMIKLAGVHSIYGTRLVPDTADAHCVIFPIDYSPPQISVISPPDDHLLDDFPAELVYHIEDWTGVDDTMIWVSFDSDTIYVPAVGLSFVDDTLTVNLADAGIEIDGFAFTICLGAADMNYPIECVNRGDTCFIYEVAGPSVVEYLLPSETVVTSCIRQEIIYHASGMSDIDWSSLRFTVGAETDITLSDPRIEVREDTLVFTPDSDWPSCEVVYCEVTALADIRGIDVLDLPVGGSFMIDFTPPLFSGITPMGRILTPTPTISLNIDDICTGVNPDSIWLSVEIDGGTTTYTIADPSLTWLRPELSFGFGSAGIVLELFDTVTICVSAADSAELCGANRDSICWEIDYYELVCSLAIDISADAGTICMGDTVRLTSSAAGGMGDIVYEWSPADGLEFPDSADTDAFPLLTTTYRITAVDDSGCVAIDSVTVTVLPLPEIAMPDSVVCRDSLVVITADDGFDSYLWSTGDSGAVLTIIADWDGGREFWLEVEQEGCFARDTFTVTTEICEIPCTLDIAVSADTTICLGASAHLWVDVGSYEGFVEYSWTPSGDLDDETSPNPIATPEATTEYRVIVTHSEMCLDTAFVNVTVLPLPEVAMPDSIVCRDSLVTITADDGFDSYLWSTGDSGAVLTIIADWDGGREFWLEVEQDGCFARDTFTITTEICEIPCTLEIAVSADTTICLGASAHLRVDAGSYEGFVEYSWTPSGDLDDETSPNPIATPETTTEYRVIVTHSELCLDTAFVTVTVLPLPEVAIPDSVVCLDSLVVITADDGFDSYLWSTGESGAVLTIIADWDGGRGFWLEVEQDGCFARGTFTITTEICDSFICELWVIASSEADSICIGDTVSISAVATGGVGTVNYLWTPVEWLSDASSAEAFAFPTSDIVYTITAVDDSGCVAIDSVFIRVVDCSDLPVSECFARPSPFTPSGDGFHDFGKLDYPQMQSNRGTAYIYTVDNQLVRTLRNGDDYTSQSGTIYWNGRDSTGRLMPNGPYLYVIQVDGETICNGTIYIAR